MAAALVSIVSMAVLGLPIALAVDRRARGPLLIGTAFLYGSGLVFFVLLAHVRWTLVTVVAGLLGCWVAAVATWWLRRNPETQRPSNPVPPHILDLVTLLTLAG